MPLSKPLDIVNGFAEFFESVHQIRSTDIEAPIASINNHNYIIHTVEENDILKAAIKFKNKDGILSLFVKDWIAVLAEPLKSIFNLMSHI